MFREVIAKTSGVLFYMVQYGCIAHCVMEHVADFVVCNGPSMKPTINSSDIVLTEFSSVRKNTIQKGDVVICKSPTNPRNYICKRVLGMQGDKMHYTASEDGEYRKLYIPKGHVWLEGDNKENSTDSREYGPVPYGLIRSRVFFKVWPIHDIGSITFPGETS